ncbi:MAG: zf-HC2 domain-containing protein [Candidatus Eisenbacteria bacterium]
MSERCPSRGELLAYVEGHADERAAEAARSHLGECVDCARSAESLRETVSLLRAAPRGTSPMDDCPETELTELYAEGSLTGADAARAEEHLARCRSCLALLADLWLPEPEGLPAPPTRVERVVLDVLAREGRTAIVSWVRGAVSLVRGFGDALGEVSCAATGERLAPAFARGERSVRFGWEGGEGLTLECEVSEASGGPALLGRLASPEEAVRAVSVSLRGAGSSRGPASLDDRGRFGAWPLSAGENTLTLSGAPVPGGRLEFTVEVVVGGD